MAAFAGVAEARVVSVLVIELQAMRLAHVLGRLCDTCVTGARERDGGNETAGRERDGVGEMAG